MDEYRRKLGNLENELTRQAAGLQGLQDSCSEVYNHIVAVFNAVHITRMGRGAHHH